MTPSQVTPAEPARQDPPRSRTRRRQEQATAYAAFSDPFEPPLSQRCYAQQRGIPRSTLGDWLRQDDPKGIEPDVVAFYRSPPGQRWLRRQVLALHLVFRHHAPCGLRPLALYLQLSHLDAFVGASYGAVHDFDASVQTLLRAFGEQERTRLAQVLKANLAQRNVQQKDILACPDEHFHAPSPCLVAVEPVSNFILAETYRAQRDGDTWTAVLTQATQDLPVRIVGLCSDDASGLRRCAAVGLGVPHCPDLFHLQHALAGPLLLPLHRRSEQAQKQCQQAQEELTLWQAAADLARVAEQRRGETPRCQQTREQFYAKAIAQGQAEVVQAQQAAQQTQQQHEQAVAAVRRLGEVYHPFDRQSGKPVPAEEMQQRLQEPVAALQQVVQAADLSQKAQDAADKAGDSLVRLVGVVACFWSVLRAAVEALELKPAAETEVYEYLLGGYYWQAAAPRAATAEERQRLANLSEGLLAQAWAAGGALSQLTPEERKEVEEVARQGVTLFGRSSSCVEGRNGRLALFAHGQGRLSEQRLQALTVMHNYIVERADGTTAAERFFGDKPQEVMAWLLQRMPELPRPAAKRPKRPRPKPPTAA
jgi:hypothetical protein